MAVKVTEELLYDNAFGLSAVEADSNGETEAVTTQRDVVRQGVVNISVSFSVTAKWLKTLTAYSKQDKIVTRRQQN